MRVKRRTGVVLVAAFVVGGLVVATPSGATSRSSSSPTGGFDVVSALSPTSRTTGVKSTTGQLAQSDPALLGRTDATPVNVMVKLDYDAAASYTGDIAGLAATSPSVTGEELSGDSSAEQAYAAYTDDIDAQFRSAVAAIPGADLGESFTTVYGGVQMTVPANQVDALLALPNVAAVQTDVINQPQTDSSTTFIGAPTIWNQEGGQALAGKGVIFADLDTGVWPEHPSLADNPALGSPPAAPSGERRACQFGDNPLTPATDVFQCNRKLIGGRAFMEAYNTFLGDDVYVDLARDSDGHGTHTTSTAAGNVVANAPIFGIQRGPISGVAPGAWVLSYKVCGPQGCVGSDSVAAIEQAIADGADVINYSIGGGTNPFTDPVELAFRDAYEAGITVATSAGNDGPAAGTTEHLSPWIITVAASTQTREFQSTLTLTDGSASATFIGSSITNGVTSATPVVLAEAVDPTGSNLCGSAFAPGSVAGKIVACERGGTTDDGVAIGRVQKGFNVKSGGAAGMILYNPTLADTETDNHFLPTVHLADGTAFRAFMAAHPTATASFTQGVKANGQGDVMAEFSSRGPGGLFLKPDITAPGVQILAGHTPTPDAIPGGPAGEYFQAIAGTSMSSPHIAGSAILLQALHPTWGPGAIKSALMTTATTDVDEVHDGSIVPADPFDFGAGRVDLTKAGSAPVVFEDTAKRMTAKGNDPVQAMNVNTPSINLPTMPGSVTVRRTATNVTKQNYNFKIETTAPDGTQIQISPKSGKIKAGQKLTFTIKIASNAPEGQYFGEIRLVSKGNATLHLPIAFYNQQGDVTLAQSCNPTTIAKKATTTCTISATNEGFADASVVTMSTVTNELRLADGRGGWWCSSGRTTTKWAKLSGTTDPAPAIARGETPGPGFVDLEALGIPAVGLTDEESLTFTGLPDFLYGGDAYTSLDVVSDGYLVVGGTGQNADIQFEPQTLPDPARPNDVLAPYWTDLDRVEVRAAVVSAGPTQWIVAQLAGHIWGTDLLKTMQVWIELGATEGISYAYDDATIADKDTNDQAVTVGAESVNGLNGAQIEGLPEGSYVITTTPAQPGETLTYTVKLTGQNTGTGTLTTTMVSDVVAGKTIVRTNVKVTKK